MKIIVLLFIFALFLTCAVLGLMSANILSNAYILEGTYPTKYLITAILASIGAFVCTWLAYYVEVKR